jgi:hypothetical protein
MNERILKLAEQAGMLRDKFGLYHDARDPDDGVDLEKFAELIVRECITVVDECNLVDDDPIANIKNHFGLDQ